MDKLIELLNEYRPNSWMEYMGGIAYIGADQYSYPVDCEVLTIISKEYGFIKRLVDNDKTDTNRYYIDTCGKPLATKEEKADILISKLAISDTPIEDLISYLN